MARKMATAPKGEIFEVSNFISLLSPLRPRYPLPFPLKTSPARRAGKSNGSGRDDGGQKIELYTASLAPPMSVIIDRNNFARACT